MKKQSYNFLLSRSDVPDRTSEVLRAAHELGGKQVKRFILLGSAVSILNSFDDMSAAGGKPYTEDDWNPVRTIQLCCFP